MTTKQEIQLKVNGEAYDLEVPPKRLLLDFNPHPTEQDVRWGLTGNLCRCTGYVKIVEAILATAKRL